MYISFRDVEDVVDSVFIYYYYYYWIDKAKFIIRCSEEEEKLY